MSIENTDKFNSCSNGINSIEKSDKYKMNIIGWNVFFCSLLLLKLFIRYDSIAVLTTFRFSFDIYDAFTHSNPSSFLPRDYLLCAIYQLTKQFFFSKIQKNESTHPFQILLCFIEGSEFPCWKSKISHTLWIKFFFKFSVDYLVEKMEF